jgi:hypothetical protein
MPITGDRGSDGRRIKSEPKKEVAAKPEPAEYKPKYVGGQIVSDDDEDDWTGVRDNRVQTRKDLTDAIAAKGGTQKTYPIATNRLYDKMFRSGKPDGKLDKWSKEDQQRISVGNRIAKQYVEEGDDGHYGIITSIERGGADANGRCNEDGTESVWRKLFGRDMWEERAEREKQEKQVVERRQTEAEAEDDSHLTEGQRQLKRHRAQQAQEEQSGGGFFGGFFSGKDLWEERADRARALEAEEQYAAAAKHSEPTDAEEESGILGKIWHWATHE